MVLLDHQIPAQFGKSFRNSLVLSLSTPSALFGAVSCPALGMEQDNGGGFTQSHGFQAQEASSGVCAAFSGWVLFLTESNKLKQSLFNPLNIFKWPIVTHHNHH